MKSLIIFLLLISNIALAAETLSTAQQAEQAFAASNYRRALPLYFHWREEDANAIEPRIKIAQCYLAMQQMDAAKQQITELLNQQIPDARAYVMAAEIAQQENRLADAEQYFKTALRYLTPAQPEYRMTLVQLMTLYTQQNKLDAAKQIDDQLTALQP
jgi:tetratricopeptide (TPR) repeat protein